MWIAPIVFVVTLVVYFIFKHRSRLHDIATDADKMANHVRRNYGPNGDEL